MNVSEAIGEAARRLVAGEVIGLPTETVYGLAGVPEGAGVIDAIFALKGRPPERPLPLMAGSQDQAWSRAGVVTDLARRLGRRLWPGPLTLVVEAGPEVPPGIHRGLGTVGLRVPAHPVALQVLAQVGRPLAVTSANRSGDHSPASVAAAMTSLGAASPWFLDAGPCPGGVPSTVVDVTGAAPAVLRAGGLPAAMLARAGATDAEGPLLHRLQGPGLAIPPSIRLQLDDGSGGSDGVDATVSACAQLRLEDRPTVRVLPDDPVGFILGLEATLTAPAFAEARRVAVRPPVEEGPLTLALCEWLARAG